MRRFIRQIGLVVLAILLLLSTLDVLYTWILSETPVYGIGRNQKVDYLIGGDSRSMLLHAEYLSDVTGKRVVNISSAAFTLDDLVLMVDYFFKRGNTADTFLLQIDPRFGTFQKIEKDFEYHAHLLREKGLFTPRVPFKYYLDNRGDIKPTKVLSAAKNMLRGGEKDRLKDTAVKKPSWFKVDKRFNKDVTYEVFRIEEIIRLREFLLSKGVKEVVVFTPPHLPSWAEIQSDSSYFKNIVKGEGFKYVDMSLTYSDTAYFRDHLHLRYEKYMEFNRYFAGRMLSGRR